MKRRSQLRKRQPLNDFVQADRGQPAQCSQKHRSEYARRQAALALQRCPSWAYGRDRDRCAGRTPKITKRSKQPSLTL